MNTSPSNLITMVRTSTRPKTLAVLFWLKRAVPKQGRSGLELKVPPVALGVIAAALMWAASSAAPAFDFMSQANSASSAHWEVTEMQSTCCTSGAVAAIGKPTPGGTEYRLSGSAGRLSFLLLQPAEYCDNQCERLPRTRQWKEPNNMKRIRKGRCS
jgi:hypothetical protein